jgi:hypothetical protein
MARTPGKQAFMSRSDFAMPSRAISAIAGIALAAFLLPAAAPAQTAPAADPAAQASAASADANAAFLSKASALYYNTTKQGLTGFDCAIHPDWANIFKTVQKAKGTAPEDDDKPVALLNSVKITIHARMAGPGSGVDWNPPDPTTPPDQSTTDLLNTMHQGMAQMLQGFLQFWTPFVNGSVIPDSTAGLDVTKTETGHTIHAVDGTTSLTEVLDSDNVLKEFNVDMGGTKVSFDPTYKPTPNGLLVSNFSSLVQPAGGTPAQDQKMKVGVEYQTLKGFLIPQTLTMDVAGTGTFVFTFDSCTVNPPAQ